MAYNLFASTTALGDLLNLFRHFMVGVLYVLSEIFRLGNLNIVLNIGCYHSCLGFHVFIYEEEHRSNILVAVGGAVVFQGPWGPLGSGYH